MDTQFEDIVLFFLSGITYKYKTNMYKPAMFDNRLSKPALEEIMEEIYQKTDNFASLQDKLNFGRRWSIANIMMVIAMLFLLIAAFQSFKMGWVLIFVGVFVISGGYYLYLTISEFRIDRDIDSYEKKIAAVLASHNEQLKEKGLKLTVMKEYVIIILQAEYKFKESKVKLVSGSRDLQPFFSFNRLGLAPNNRPSVDNRSRNNSRANSTTPAHQRAIQRVRNGLGRNIMGSGRENPAHELAQLEPLGSAAAEPQGPGKKYADVKFKGKLKYTQICEAESI